MSTEHTQHKIDFTEILSEISWIIVHTLDIISTNIKSLGRRNFFFSCFAF